EGVSEEPLERVDRAVLDVDGWEFGASAGLEVWIGPSFGFELAGQASSISFDEAHAELSNTTGPPGGQVLGGENVEAMISDGTGLYVALRAGVIIAF
ncbi:MAG: hypothetical protein MJB57_09520, partial [Gemmatimonadetes bacterium]|nr:hypothetical protein [Gemmatimonadota bacterium]